MIARRASSRRGARPGVPRERAALRVGRARERQRRLIARQAEVEGTTEEPGASREASAGRAALAAREAWLYWVDHGRTATPWEDGEWGAERPRS